MVEPYKQLYTISEAAEVLRMSGDSVREYIRKGLLPCLKLKRMKIRGEDLEAFINKYPTMTADELQAEEFE